MKTFNTILLLTTFSFFISCNGSAQQQKTESNAQASTFENISVDEFNQTFVEAGADTVILDVRTEREFDAGAIPGAMLIDISSPDFKTKVDQLDRSKTYVVYCRTGRRSVAASNIMVSELGFEDVKNMEGGYSVWSR
jgi:rhodanese-related sulfurtransferase